MEVSAVYRGGAKFEVAARGHRVMCDQPVSNAGNDEGMSPPEFLLASLATCAGYYAVQYLKTRKLSADNVEVRVVAHKATHPARLAAFEIDVTLPQLDALHEAGLLRAVKACLIHNTLLAEPAIDIRLHQTPDTIGTELILTREDETNLARRLMTGDATAFDRFVEHFRAKIFHYSWLMCGQREDAEDVAQDSLLKVFESFDQLREPERVRPWIFRIARNACLMKRRKSVFEPAHELSLDDYLPALERDNGRMKLQIADWSRLPDRQLLDSEMKGILDRAIAELPDGYKSVILMRDVEDLSTKETAHVLDLAEDVVKQRLHRARLAVRQKLDEYLRERPHANS